MNSVDFQNYEYFTHAVTANGKLLEIPLRKGKHDSAFIDALTFTIRKTTIDLLKGICFKDTEYIAAYSEILKEIFGFGITEKREGKGRYFYQSFYRLGIKEAEYGTVHIGGQNETILVELTGTACQAAKAGWEIRLYDFLKQAVRPQITRIDCAHDFFDGEYTPEKAMLHHDKGLFDRGNKRPKSECIGTAWRLEDYSGKTFYIGRRGSSKLVRVYEKGRQLGDPNSAWVRFEIEFRAKDCVIPLEILTAPGEFLTGAYPVGEQIFDTPSQRIEATQKKADTTFDDKLKHTKNQVGRLVRLLKELQWSDEEIVAALIAEEGKYPKGLHPMEYDCTSETVEYMDLQTYEAQIGEINDSIDELAHIAREIDHFDKTNLSKTEQQHQLVREFDDDLKRFMEIWREGKYYSLSERDLQRHLQESENQRKQNEFIDYLYLKYGSLFAKSLTHQPRKGTSSWH